MSGSNLESYIHKLLICNQESEENISYAKNNEVNLECRISYLGREPSCRHMRNSYLGRDTPLMKGQSFMRTKSPRRTAHRSLQDKIGNILYEKIRKV